ncbi:type I 3-dehydroquinate dehydratase [Staphylococcus xylosus]|uniref:type I 3-dehydroquinate dehydratase n=1 Tax=Staphylococcus xylosus TaxID=1288 RepID=UPI000D1D3436|nr:type I 3-dehydroquinate dehydratase [Staphylococcus xylosus]PTI53576.1 type I 3-dehydroquinate dehydratase [Staphylococcus xylosus]
MAKVDIAVTIAPENELEQVTIEDLEQYQTSIDIIERRIDQWSVFDETYVAKMAEDIYNLNLNKKLLVTYRTKTQGGEGQLANDKYLNALEKIIPLDYIDMIDIEYEEMMPIEKYQSLIESAHRKNLEVVLSQHNFKKTPKLEVLKRLYYKMHQLEPDYLKVAVMPHDKQDVLNLLNAMSESSDTVSQHVVGIAMSKLGLISRTAQGLFGGSVSYGCLDAPKAPGQIHVETLKQQIKLYE